MSTEKNKSSEPKLEPYAYLRYIFDKLPLASALKDYDALSPWNLTTEHLAGNSTQEGVGK